MENSRTDVLLASIFEILEEMNDKMVDKGSYSKECLLRYNGNEVTHFRMVDDDCYIVETYDYMANRYIYLQYNKEDFEEDYEALD